MNVTEKVVMHLKISLNDEVFEIEELMKVAIEIKVELFELYAVDV